MARKWGGGDRVRGPAPAGVPDMDAVCGSNTELVPHRLRESLPDEGGMAECRNTLQRDGYIAGGGGGYGGYRTEWGVHCGPPGRDCRDALEGRGRGAMRGFKSGSKGGYRRLEKRLGGSTKRLEGRWGGPKRLTGPPGTPQRGKGLTLLPLCKHRPPRECTAGSGGDPQHIPSSTSQGKGAVGAIHGRGGDVRRSGSQQIGVRRGHGHVRTVCHIPRSGAAAAGLPQGRGQWR